VLLRRVLGAQWRTALEMIRPVCQADVVSGERFYLSPNACLAFTVGIGGAMHDRTITKGQARRGHPSGPGVMTEAHSVAVASATGICACLLVLAFQYPDLAQWFILMMLSLHLGGLAAEVGMVADRSGDHPRSE
jgi:hypothetical protein